MQPVLTSSGSIVYSHVVHRCGYNGQQLLAAYTALYVRHD